MPQSCHLKLLRCKALPKGRLSGKMPEDSGFWTSTPSWTMAMPFSSIATGVKGRNLSAVRLQMLRITHTIKLNKSQIHNKTAKSRNHFLFPKGLFWNNPTMNITTICWLQDAGPDGSSTPNDGRLLSQWPSVLQNMDIVMTIHDTHWYTRTTSSLCTWNQTKTIGTDSSCHLPSVLATAILLPECWMAPDCSGIVPTLFAPWWDHSKQAHGKTKAKTTNSTFLKPIVPHQYLLHHWQITFHACSNIGGKGLLKMESITSLCESWLFLVSYTPQDHTSIRQSISYPIRKCCLQADPWHTKAALPSMCRIALFQLWQGLPRKLFSEGNNNVATTNTTSNRKATHLMTQDPSWENMPTIQRGNLEACQSVSIR